MNAFVARTLEGGANQAKDLWLARSEFAEKMAGAIEWADTHVDDDWTTRLLFIPALLVYALWFQRSGEDRIYIVQSATGLLVEGSEISANSLLDRVLERARGWGPFDLSVLN